MTSLGQLTRLQLCRNDAFEALLDNTDGTVATITLNRPERLNTIVPPMPDDIEQAIGLPERDPNINRGTPSARAR